MFQNALQGKNELGRMLAAKHKRDPLHKTFLIMDEVHKLMDGDLSAAESADFNVIQNFIHKSYASSGAASVRPLLMTATPITDTPNELFTILNTLIAKPADRLMNFEQFRRTYTTDAGDITDGGAAYFQDRAKGLISYLNREYDPTTFAQPHFTEIIVPVGGKIPPTLEDLVARCTADLELPDAPDLDDCGALDEEEEAEYYMIKESDLKPKAQEKALAKVAKTYKKRRAACEKRNAATRKAHAKLVKSVLKSAVACWTAQKKAFGAQKGPSQISELEACFGKKQKGVADNFPTKPAYMEAVQARFAGVGNFEANSARSNTGAVVDVEGNE
jgi:hypothetical protein